ncbi:SLC13 family permease [Amycolatopsis methanolica]|uniref:Dicarboxylate carrier MatC domain-containing protein n=1 Tax=Amycolatopsis methanolica 239 TaxID=1068978 RepID=A0A076MPD2_AMYME|nr:SLC13 family permease [Amycolatopsis methanolica]AIJ20811.1 dicarboxylate carrier MatC domain-containing protein [Amycolatopsis methanolica 239]
MSAELISILVLAVVFVIATTRSINMGVLSFAAAFGVGTLAANLDADEIFAGFPGDLFVVLVGVTFLFAIARANGTTDWLVDAAVRLVRGRVALIPWVTFAITAVLTAIGAVSPAAVAIVAPVALGFAAQYGIHPLLMGAMVVHGAQAGGFSPISVYGTIVNGIVAREHLGGSEITLFLASFVVNLVIAAIVFVVLRKRQIVPTTERERELVAAGTGGPPDGTGSAGGAAPGRIQLNAPRIATLASLAVLVVATLVFDLDVGLTAMTLAVVLSVIWPATSRKAVGEVTWPTVLLICGVLTYVGVLQEMGTIEWAGEGVGGIGAPLLAALLLCYIGAIVSAFASSVGIMGALIPLAVPFLALGTVGPVGMICALAVSATVVDVSPFSTNGALVLANAREVDRDAFFRQLLVYGGIMVAVVPAVVWLVFIVPGLG